MTDNQRRGIEQWQCGLCKAINDMVDSVCSNCKFDYDAELDTPIVTRKTTVVAHEQNQSSITKHRKKDKDLSSFL